MDTVKMSQNYLALIVAQPCKYPKQTNPILNLHIKRMNSVIYKLHLKKKLPCSTATSPVLIPETMSLSSHSFMRYAGNQDAMGNKEKAIFLAFCAEQLKQ